MDVVAPQVEKTEKRAIQILRSVGMSVTKVVILNWNGREHLERFLPSVVANTPPGVGIVVADNGSTDDSAEFTAGNFPNVEIIRLADNYGFAGGYNRALGQLEADYFVLLNSDAEPAPGWLDPLLVKIGSDPKIAAVVPKLLSYDERGKFEYAGACGGFIDGLGYPFCRGRILSTVESDEGQYDSARDIFWGTGACLLVRADVFRELGGFDAGFFAHMEEIDLCWRAQLRGYRICVEPMSVVYHLGGGTLPQNTPRKTFLNFRNNLMMLYKNLSGRSLWWVLTIRMVLDGIAALGWLFAGKPEFFKAVRQAHREFRRLMPELKIMRREIQASGIAKPQFIYRGSIVLRYILGRKRFGNLM